MTYETIGILGAGAWGTALAVTAYKAGRTVRIWAREEVLARSLSMGKGNPTFLPGQNIPTIPASHELDFLAGCDAIMAVVPAQFMRTVLQELSNHIEARTPIVLCAKGIEQNSLNMMSAVLAQSLPKAPIAVLSGPSFASEVAQGLPTAVTLACPDEGIAQKWMSAIGRAEFRPYYSDDIIGAEIGGAVKNVLAIACGIVEGLELGRSAHAALIARGFAEMVRLGVAMGAKTETLSGLCGLGDLVLTCSSAQSRNMSFGKALAKGQTAKDILTQRRAVTEGAASAPALLALSERYQVDMPICNAVHAIISDNLSVEQAITTLLHRPFAQE